MAQIRLYDLSKPNLYWANEKIFDDDTLQDRETINGFSLNAKYIRYPTYLLQQNKMQPLFLDNLIDRFFCSPLKDKNK